MVPAADAAMRADPTTSEASRPNLDAHVSVGDPAFKVLPVSTKIRIDLPAMARVFTHASDQRSTVEEFGDHSFYSIHKCPE